MQYITDSKLIIIIITTNSIEKKRRNQGVINKGEI